VRAGPRLTCALGSIAAGAAVGLTIIVQPTVAGALTDTAAVTGDQVDPNPSNDTASVTTAVLPLATIRVNPGVVPLGRVTLVIGTGFEPNTPVSVGLAGGFGARTATPAADGSFTVPLVVFSETTPGTRLVEARSVPDPATLVASAKLLVVSHTLVPPNFVGRN
jgi:hypothetical protein